MPRYTLVYFNLRGRAEVARMIFAEAGVQYEDRRLDQGEWAAYKSKTPYGQLPVLEVDDVQIAQSTAINRYLAREFGLVGKNSLEDAIADMHAEACQELIPPMVEIFYNTKDEKKKAELREKFCSETAPKYLSKFEEALVLNNGYLVGGRLTWADFVLISTIRWLEQIVTPETLAPFPKVKDHIVRIESLPKIAAWIAKRPQTDG